MRGASTCVLRLYCLRLAEKSQAASFLPTTSSHHRCRKRLEAGRKEALPSRKLTSLSPIPWWAPQSKAGNIWPRASLVLGDTMACCRPSIQAWQWEYQQSSGPVLVAATAQPPLCLTVQQLGQEEVMAESQSWGAAGDSFLSWAVWLLPPLLAGPAHSSRLQPPEPQELSALTCCLPSVCELHHV